MLSKCASNIEKRAQSDKIDRELLESAKEHVVKLLLLGVGESGKSTFVKQIADLIADQIADLPVYL